VEFSSALAFAAAGKLAAAEELSPDECVVALITSSGLKDPESMNEYGEVPLAEPTLESLVRVLDEEYQFAASGFRSDLWAGGQDIGRHRGYLPARIESPPARR
jgi:threonine synthase